MEGKFNLSQIFWLLILVIAFLPLFRQKLLTSARIRHIMKMERKRGSRVITLIHRQERMSLLGIPLFRYIDINDSEAVLRAIHMTADDVPIDLILHTPGGLVLASSQIANALLTHKARVTIYVPHYAMSGGTLIALAGDEIVMSENAVLGPVDPQVGELPAASILAVLDQKSPDRIDDRTFILADVSRKAINQMKACIKKLLAKHFREEKSEELADLFSRGAWTHDYPITYEVAKSLGLPVSKEVPKEIFDLMSLFPQPTQHRPPSVEFIPEPYRHRRESHTSSWI